MLINVSEGEECRIALMEDGRLDELYMERTSSTSHVGNIYKGRVTNVEASIQAAFVDFGLGRNGFLHISDLLPTYFGRKGDGIEEFVGKKMARRDRPPIQRCLRRGDEIIVQVIKEGIGTKGPTLSTYLSVSGKMLVMMPGVNGRGVSRKIEDEEERRRLKQILDSLDPPEDCGFIIRTESVGKTKAEIERDLKYLARLWEQIKRIRDNQAAPVELYTEGDLITRTVRDVFSSDVDRIIVDNREVADRVRDVIKITNPRTRNKVELYEETVPLFHKHGIEREIEQMYSRHVPLPSGGSLVIDSTEAIVAIDVNSGKFRDHSDAEMTAFKTDMEAADEICRQLKLRDLGGVIICDFIDLRYERHRRELEKKLHDLLKRDRAKTKVLRMSEFGIIEMTRQRMRPSLKRSVYFDCPHCKGAGLVKTAESMSLDAMRRVAIAINDLKVARVEMTINPEVNFYLQNKKRRQISELEERHRKRVVVRADPHMGLDEMRLELFDNREGLVLLPELEAVQQPPLPHTTQLGVRPAGHTSQNRSGRGDRAGAGGAGGDKRQQQPGRGQQPQPPQRGRDEQRRREEQLVEDRYEMDRADENGDERDERDEQDREPQEAGAGDRGRGQDRGGDRGGRDQRDQRDQRGRQEDRRDRDQGRDRDRQQQGRGGGGGDRRGDQRQPQGRGGAERGGGGDPRDRQQQGGRRDQRDQRDRAGQPGGGGGGGGGHPRDNGERTDLAAESDARNGGDRGLDAAAVGEQGDEQSGGRRRRRRRRRGRRGRGRGGQGGPEVVGAPGDAEGQPAEAFESAGEYHGGEEPYGDEEAGESDLGPAPQEVRFDDADADRTRDVAAAAPAPYEESREAEEVFAEAADAIGRTDEHERRPEPPDMPEAGEPDVFEGQVIEPAAGLFPDREVIEPSMPAAREADETAAAKANAPVPAEEAPAPRTKSRRGGSSGGGTRGAKAKTPKAAVAAKAAKPAGKGRARGGSGGGRRKAPASEAAAPSAPAGSGGAEGEAAAQKGRRGGRGGRSGGGNTGGRSRRGRQSKADEEGGAAGGGGSASASVTPTQSSPTAAGTAPSAAPAAPTAAAKIAAEVLPTASRSSVGDRHLVRDREDHAHIPDLPRRPRSYRDLDAIPDDLD